MHHPSNQGRSRIDSGSQLILNEFSGNVFNSEPSILKEKATHLAKSAYEKGGEGYLKYAAIYTASEKICKKFPAAFKLQGICKAVVAVKGEEVVNQAIDFIESKVSSDVKLMNDASYSNNEKLLYCLNREEEILKEVKTIEEFRGIREDLFSSCLNEEYKMQLSGDSTNTSSEGSDCVIL